MDSRPDRALRLLIAGASAVVILAGLKWAGEIVLPIVFAAFLSIAALPAVNWLRARGVPSALAIGIVVAVAAAVLGGVTTAVAGSVRAFGRDIDRFELPLEHLWAQIGRWVSTVGLTVETDMSELVTPEDVIEVMRNSLEAVVRFLGHTLIVLITLTFILLESSEIEQKLRLAFGSDASPAGPFAGAGQKVERYLVIKTAVGLVTGLLAGLVCWAVGVDFWMLWGLIAFLLNYIPAVGYVAAGFPPVLLAAVEIGPGAALACLLGYLVIHVVLTNLIEPRLLGQGLGLSPLVVFLSLIFWGWIWGPVGMLLCVPMTAMVQLVLDSSDETRWIAVLLGSPSGVRRQASTAAPLRPRSYPPPEPERRG
ncbi:MAG: AI-2E family transporter [Myxococcota bacterium]